MRGLGLSLQSCEDSTFSQITTNGLLHAAGVVNGVQGSLAGLFQSTSYLAGLLLPDPEKFDWLMLGSWTMVFIAALMYTLWVLASRNQDEIDEEIEGQPALQTLQC